ncbi:MAG: 4Fe-4S dicluster domain-containing protein [Eubacteriales bacterium]|nr:4Fe-4S dicluster domain-containing protein [Eubacteriales bacterium]
MKRNIIVVDEEKCNGCGNCIIGCHEGALALINGKARLIKDSYCDGLGACLPTCPTDAITIEERDTDAFTAPAPGSPADLEMQAEAAAQEAVIAAAVKPVFRGCPGSAQRTMDRPEIESTPAIPTTSMVETSSELRQWPVQIKLLPTQAQFYQGAKLLIAADCAAYSRANFHQEFIKGKVCLIGCPKLDSIDYADKLTDIIRNNDIRSVTIVKMEVPCCGGLDFAAKKALQASGKMIPWQVVTISTDGRIIEE